MSEEHRDKKPKPRILVVDDQADVRTALKLLLKSEGYETELADSPRALLSALEQGDFDALIMDLNYSRDTTSGAEGLEALSAVRALDSLLPVVVMTAWGSVDVAVEAMRRGAGDFVQKPWENARLLATLRTQVQLGRALHQEARLKEENRNLLSGVPSDFVARSADMQSVMDVLRKVGPSDACVLITGENGTGKNLAARLLHGFSSRSERSFVRLDLASLAESVLHSELFGHVKGAFTDAGEDRPGRFELADGGTLFLDEIANIPVQVQAKLLRFIESGEFERVGSSRTRRVDVRLVSATNANMADLVESGAFRRDLYYRLNTVEVRLPPLRSRRDDIEALARHFLSVHASRYRKSVTRLAPEALDALLDYGWPGNVRELDHVIERAVILADGPRIGQAELALRHAPAQTGLEDLSLEDVERLLIRKALDRSGGNVSRAAEALDLSRSALYRRMKKHGLP
jgi:DNA-binding NtrC family response regulator